MSFSVICIFVRNVHLFLSAGFTVPVDPEGTVYLVLEKRSDPEDYACIII